MKSSKEANESPCGAEGDAVKFNEELGIVGASNRPSRSIPLDSSAGAPFKREREEVRGGRRTI